jgi:hypothetical protein
MPIRMAAGLPGTDPLRDWGGLIAPQNWKILPSAPI